MNDKREIKKRKNNAECESRKQEKKIRIAS